MDKELLLEVCVDSLGSAITAQLAGANRVELCQNLPIGGTTPSAALIKLTRAKLSIPVFILIRPRGGDFNYSPHEIDVMKEDIIMARDLGTSGIVTGALTSKGDVHVEYMIELISAARPLPVTFHRAFDMTKDPARALETLISLGVDRVLTSGQENTAREGSELIRELVSLAKGRITIIPGAGVNAENIRGIVMKTGATEIHMSGKVLVPSGMTYRNNRVDMGDPNITEYQRYATSAAAIIAARQALEK